MLLPQAGFMMKLCVFIELLQVKCLIKAMQNIKIMIFSSQRNWIDNKCCRLLSSRLVEVNISLFSLRKHANSNILKILPPKNDLFLDKKNSDVFLIFAQNIDCECSLQPPRWGGTNEYPQSMFWSEIRKYNVYPYKPQFYYIKVGFKGGVCVCVGGGGVKSI